MLRNPIASAGAEYMLGASYAKVPTNPMSPQVPCPQRLRSARSLGGLGGKSVSLMCSSADT